MIGAEAVQTLQDRYGEEIDAAVARFLADKDSGGPFYAMMRYQFGFADERLEPIASAGGKRFRPALCLLACQGAGGSWRQALTAAAAIELLHNFSLIHDDIEDHDPARRHRPTVWKLWGEPQAINVGDAVFAIAGRAMLDAHPNPAVSVELSRHFQDVTTRLTEGQYLDMSFETRQDVSADEYIAMIERKTGALIAFSVWSGGYIAGAEHNTTDALHQFGMALGKAFQIQDDVLGIWAPRDVTGKEPAKDLVNRKKTLPVLIAWERSTGPRRELLNSYFQRRFEDVETVRAILDETDARRETQQRGAEQLSGALQALASANLLAEERQELESVARALAGA